MCPYNSSSPTVRCRGEAEESHIGSHPEVRNSLSRQERTDSGKLLSDHYTYIPTHVHTFDMHRHTMHTHAHTATAVAVQKLGRTKLRPFITILQCIENLQWRTGSVITGTCFGGCPHRETAKMKVSLLIPDSHCWV